MVDIYRKGVYIIDVSKIYFLGEAMEEHKLNNSDALQFLLAGNAVFTLKNESNGERVTYRIIKCKDNESLWFVQTLVGSDNEGDYIYIGVIREWKGVHTFSLTAKSRMTSESNPVKGISYLIPHLRANKMPDVLHIYHANHCGRCGRLLTVPESIESGIGPECANIMGLN